MLTGFLLQTFVFSTIQRMGMLERRSEAGLSTHETLRRILTHRQRAKSKLEALQSKHAAQERDYARAQSLVKHLENEVVQWKEKVEVSKQASISLSFVVEWSCTDGLCDL